jgi:hypothetical protein
VVFSVYHIARYVNTAAEVGKKEYPLTFSVNCWLNKPCEPAGIYLSDGSISKWRYCAPNIVLYAPDIYLSDFSGISGEYLRRGETLFIPECATHRYDAARNILCVGRHHGVCYSPFGFEDMGSPLNAQQMALFGVDVADPVLQSSQNLETYGRINRMLNGMIPKLTNLYGTDELKADSGERDSVSVFQTGDVRIQADYLKPEVACLILQESDHEVFILAYEAAFQITSVDPGSRAWISF